MSRILIAAAAFFSFGGVLAAPASAQDSEERINQLIIFGDDPCPPSTDEEIIVCARKDESERYRIPEILRQSEGPANEAWNNRVLAYEAVLDTGTLSCSPVGAGGWTGCTRKMIEQAYAADQTDASLRFSELIAEERARRLEAIDEKASEVQERVEEAERAYFERQQQKEQQAQEEAEGLATPPPTAEE